QDDIGFKATNSFTLRVTPVNDPPTISFIAKQITRAGVPVGPISFTIGDVEAATETLSVSASSDNQGVIPDSNILLGGNGFNRTVTLFPTTTVAGNANITIAVSDNGVPPLKT